MVHQADGAGWGRPAELSIEGGRVSTVLPLAETIDLSRPCSYADVFGIGSGSPTELRIGGVRDYFFVRVVRSGAMIELSSGLMHGGAYSEASHGVWSGESVNESLVLHSSLKFDGQVFKLDLRVKADCVEGDTLIYGSSRFACASIGLQARVELVEGDSADREDEVEPVGTAEEPVIRLKRAPLPAVSTDAKAREASEPREEASPSRVRFSETDDWCEYEAPAPSRLG